MSFELKTIFWKQNCVKKRKTLQGTKAKQKLTANRWKENSRESGQQAILNNQLQKSNQLVDWSKNSSRKDGISHKIWDHKHQFRRKDLGGSNLLSRITANRGSLLNH